MKRVKIAELKDQLSQHLRAVEKGAEVVVTDRDRPIARIVPFERGAEQVSYSLPLKDFAEIRDRRRTPAAWKISSTELLLEERRDR
jgi:prevent-host-death family protein